MFTYLTYRLNELLYGGSPISIPKGALVLEIASGGKPYWRSNVLVDKFIFDNSERDSAIVVDRDFVAADIMHLPFKDKAFDFVIARHILEHVPEPQKFIAEMERVAKAGYIETPSSLSEDMFGWPFHIWKADIEDGTLVLTKKTKDTNAQLKRLQPHFDHNADLQQFSMKNRSVFYTCFTWNGAIPYRINGETVPDQKEVQSTNTDATGLNRQQLWQRYSLKRKIKIVLDRIRRALFAGIKNVDLPSIVRCPYCLSQLDTKSKSETLTCTNSTCHKQFAVHDNVPILL